ncbi:MAG: hypothetical protein ACP5NQ_10140, partial [Vulcanisaeta sp.]
MGNDVKAIGLAIVISIIASAVLAGYLSATLNISFAALFMVFILILLPTVLSIASEDSKHAHKRSSYSHLVRLYMVVNRDEDYESVVRATVNELNNAIMNALAKSKRLIALSIVKLYPRYANQLLDGNLINTPQAITQVATLVRRDGVKALPTLVIDGKKVLEGPQPPQAVRYAIIDEITKTAPNITQWMGTRGEAIAERTVEKQSIQ